LHRRLAVLARENQGKKFSTNGDVARTWNNSTIFASPSSDDDKRAIQITCVECYFRGATTFELEVKAEVDITDTISNITNQLVGGIVDYASDLFAQSLSGRKFDFDVPDFNFTLPPLPSLEVSFQFDELDLYLLLDTKLPEGVQLTIPLLGPETGPTAISVNDTDIGTFITADLILSAEGSREVDITSGIHFKVKPPLGFKLDLFSPNVSEVLMGGGQFELLPIVVQPGNVVLRAALRVGMHVGFDMSPDGLEDVISAGIRAGVFVNVADYVANVTSAAEEAGGGPKGCDLKVLEQYTLGVAAAAGATFALAGNTWGFEPSTVLAVRTTSLSEKCASTSVPTRSVTSSRPSRDKRQRATLTTATSKTVVTHLAVLCSSVGLVSCPASLRTTLREEETRILTATFPKGQRPTFSDDEASGSNSATGTTAAFGSFAHELSAATGAPETFISEEKGNGSSSNKLVVGLLVGLGLPTLIGLVVLGAFWVRRKR
ncbi:hypothetical protein QBC42DRAFT_162696, partial [Cladorrhinum samala]